MTTVGAQVVVPREFKAWVAGFAAAPADLARTTLPEWEIVSDVFFDRTQAVVHVVSGDLKASGRVDVWREGDAVMGTVSYGGVMGSEGFVDYAQAEEDRGGEHAYLARGWEATEAMFSAEFGASWPRLVRGWR